MCSLAIIFALYGCETINALVLNPIIPFLLVHYGVISDLNDSSLYSGYFSAVYYIGQFICNIPFERIADKYGKKNVVLFGTATTIICNMLFAFSNNLYTSLIIRFVYGLLNANFCLLRIFISEISSKDTVARNYGYIICAWAVGAFIAPLTSMAYIETTKYPALYPLCISSLITLIIFIVAFFYLDNPSKRSISPESSSGDIEMGNVQQNKEETHDDTVIRPRTTEADERSDFATVSIICVAIYLLFSTTEIIYSEISSVLFASQNYKYTERQISLIFTANNFAGFITSLFFDKIEKFATKEKLLCTCIIIINFMLLSITCTTSFPLISIFTSIRMIMSNWAFSVIFVYLSEMTNMSKLNSISQTLGSLIKILFPIIFTNIFHYLGNDVNVIFIVIVCISLSILFIVDKRSVA